VDRRSALSAANEHYRQRNFPQVVATCRSQLAASADDVDFRLLLARALMALRRDAEAQNEVATVLRSQPKCPDAYQLLGELAFRRDELRAAEIFLREAIRLRAEDAHSQTLLEIIGAMAKSQRSKQPAAAAAKLPAASAAAGLSPSSEEPTAQVPAKTSEVESVALRLNPGASGFGEYLVSQGCISRAQLFRALHLHHSRNYRLGDAVVKLGFATAEGIEKLARRYHRALSDNGISAVA
jgi:hypothetical protein